MTFFDFHREEPSSPKTPISYPWFFLHAFIFSQIIAVWLFQLKLLVTVSVFVISIEKLIFEAKIYL